MSPHDLKASGLNHYRAERYAEAAAAFAEAATGFEAAGDRANAAEMRNNLCVVRMAQNDWVGALEAVEGTPEVFRALGDRLREAQALANLAAAHDGAGHVEQAADLYVQAIDLLGQLGETETRAACFKKLSALQVKLGQQLQALASMHSGLNLSTELSPKEKMLKEMIDKAVKLMGGSLPK
ncbi:MAG: tetratricopeptide repeat protein [Anaerolineales bacterium]|nr:tetratricopeptide repeat protein [Anaerolineales bacterium]